MKVFTYYNPARIEFGKGKEENIGQCIAEYGIRTVFENASHQNYKPE